jgi:hypothetical protein
VSQPIGQTDVYDSLEPLMVRAVQPPRYHNEHVRDFQQWYAQNEPLISQWWDQLGQLIEAPADDQTDFFLFAVIAHERELAKLQVAA